MRSPFANVQSITLPSNAVPGDARIVIGAELPPPLDTYATLNGPYVGGIILYGEGDDTTYQYIAVVEDSIAGTAIVHWGFVVGGVVGETLPGSGVPTGQEFVAFTGGNTMTWRADGITFATSATGTGMAVNSGTTLLLAALAGISINGTIVTDIDWGGSDTVDSGVDVASGNTTSALYVNGTGGAFGQAFVAPPSGEVVVLFSSRLSVNNIAQSGFVSPELKEGAVIDAGTLVTAANDQDAMRLLPASVTQINKHGDFVTYNNLIPGDSYNVTLKVRATGGAAVTYNDRRVAILPAL